MFSKVYFVLKDYEGWGKCFTRKNVNFVHLSHSLILKASSCRASSVQKNGQKIEKNFSTVKIEMMKFSAIFVRNRSKVVLFVRMTILYHFRWSVGVLIETPELHGTLKIQKVNFGHF